MLECVDALTSGNWGASRRIFRGKSQEQIDSRMHHFAMLLEVFGRSFDLGTISCERLVEVLMPPFLKLGRRLIQVPSENMTKLLFMGWSSCLGSLLGGHHEHDSKSRKKGQPVLQPRKRAQLVKALMKAKFPEVRSKPTQRYDCF